jgi:hypothetical protein
LPGHFGDQIEVSVVVQHSETLFFGGSRNEEIGNLATPLTALSKKSLHLPSADDVRSRSLNQREGVDGVGEAIPLNYIASRESNLEITDASASYGTFSKNGFECLTNE